MNARYAAPRRVHLSTGRPAGRRWVGMHWPTDGWDLFLRRMTWSLSRGHLTSRPRQTAVLYRVHVKINVEFQTRLRNPNQTSRLPVLASLDAAPGGSWSQWGPGRCSFLMPESLRLEEQEIGMRMIDRKLGGRRDLCFLEAKSRT